MTTPVKFELAKLLIQKEYDLHPDFKDSYPTIAEVVMWLYEKYGIWVSVNREPESGVFFFSVDKNKGDFFFDKGDDYSSPTESYEAAIEYCLTNLI